MQMKTHWYGDDLDWEPNHTFICEHEFLWSFTIFTVTLCTVLTLDRALSTAEHRFGSTWGIWWKFGMIFHSLVRWLAVFYNGCGWFTVLCSSPGWFTILCAATGGSPSFATGSFVVVTWLHAGFFFVVLGRGPYFKVKVIILGCLLFLLRRRILLRN